LLFAKPVTANSPDGIRHNDQVQVILFCLEEFKMQIMVRLAVQNGKTRSGEIMIGERRPSERGRRKPVTSKTGLVVDTACSGRGWSRGKKLGSLWCQR